MSRQHRTSKLERAPRSMAFRIARSRWRCLKQRYAGHDSSGGVETPPSPSRPPDSARRCERGVLRFNAPAHFGRDATPQHALTAGSLGNCYRGGRQLVESRYSCSARVSTVKAAPHPQDRESRRPESRVYPRKNPRRPSDGFPGIRSRRRLAFSRRSPAEMTLKSLR